MARFEIKYEEVVVRIGYVEADTEEEAIELFEDGGIEDDQDVDSVGLELLDIKEVC